MSIVQEGRSTEYSLREKHGLTGAFQEVRPAGCSLREVAVEPRRIGHGAELPKCRVLVAERTADCSVPEGYGSGAIWLEVRATGVFLREGYGPKAENVQAKKFGCRTASSPA